LPPLPEATSEHVASPHPMVADAGLEAFISRSMGSIKSELYDELHRQVDRILLSRVLEGTGGNLLRAAQRLGIGRETLRRRLREVGIQLNRRVETESGG
jgi:DNA-binding protein Fis